MKPDIGLASQELDCSPANADRVAIVTAHSTEVNGWANGRVWKV
jgi:hypothetical protein